MHIFRHIFLSNYWWQKSDIWSQASYRYTILWVAFLDPSDSYFLFVEERGYHKWALAHSSSCYQRGTVGIPIACLTPPYHCACTKRGPEFPMSQRIGCSFEPRSWRGVLDTVLCDNVCLWLATGQWFSLVTPVSSTNKTDRHNITEILLKVALNTINLTIPLYFKFNPPTVCCCFFILDDE
jgi:hypothetical protein